MLIRLLTVLIKKVWHSQTHKPIAADFAQSSQQITRLISDNRELYDHLERTMLTACAEELARQLANRIIAPIEEQRKAKNIAAFEEAKAHYNVR